MFMNKEKRMKKFLIGITIVGLCICTTNVWGGTVAITTIQTEEIALGADQTIELKMPSSTSRMVKLYGDLIADSSGTMDVDIYSDKKEDGTLGRVLYTVDGVGPIVIDDTPSYLISEATSGDSYVYLKVSIDATAAGARTAQFTLIMESMNANVVTAP